MVKFPSKSAVTPLEVPLTSTLAPGNGTPLELSFTEPLIVPWAKGDCRDQ